MKLRGLMRHNSSCPDTTRPLILCQEISHNIVALPAASEILELGHSWRYVSEGMASVLPVFTHFYFQAQTKLFHLTLLSPP